MNTSPRERSTLVCAIRRFATAPLVLAAGLLMAFALACGEKKTSEKPSSLVGTKARSPSVSASPQEPVIRPGQKPETDPATGLFKAEGWELVAANCSGCHSTKLVVQNRGSREHWRSLIRWMQKEQNLWTFAPDVEDKIITYLSTYYGGHATSRRSALAPHLMPPFQNAASKQAP